MGKNTLYISDLDGTLLRSDKSISTYTSKTIRTCIEEGMLFSVATARMPYGCDYRLTELELNTPGILTNGVFLYDFSDREYHTVEKIDYKNAKKVIRALKKHGLSCFLYIYDAGTISIYYDDECLTKQTQYYSDRALQSCREVRKIDDYESVMKNGEICYLTFTGEKDVLEPVCRDLDQIEEIQYSFYLNVYNGWYCLEIFSCHANKQNALIRLKDRLKCDEVVVFGDNLNDLPMIEIADRSYAPANALKEVKQMVTGVVESCDEDGVAKWLEQEWKSKSTK